MMGVIYFAIATKVSFNIQDSRVIEKYRLDPFFGYIILPLIWPYICYLAIKHKND
jgi:hypothetical protein